MTARTLLEVDEHGLFCQAGGFHVDPWGPVDRAVVTHAHADHAQPVMQRAMVAAPGLHLARARLPGVSIDAVAYGERVRIGDVVVSLHPSGHVLGAAQVRVEHVLAGGGHGEVWVVSGDYKLAPDDTCAPFEPVTCDVFITEATFGLPVFRWDEPDVIFTDFGQWWQTIAEEGRPCLAYADSLGKSARLLAGLARLGALVGPVYTHGAVERMLELYRASGVALPPTTHLGARLPLGAAETSAAKRTSRAKKPAPLLPAGALVIAPPSAQNSAWAKKLEVQGASTAYCSGWMRLRGLRRRRVVERGFALSDHADWPALLQAVRASKAERVLVTHGYATVLARALADRGIDARPLQTPWEGERAEKERAASDDVDPGQGESA